jgi:cell division protein DivIC
VIKKKNIKKLLFAAVTCYLAFVFISQEVTSLRIKAQISNEKAQLQVLKDDNQKLQDTVNLSKTPKYIEKLAREKLGLIMANETPVIDNSQNKK